MSKKSLFLILFGVILILSGVTVEITSHENPDEPEEYINSTEQEGFREFVAGKFSEKYFDISFQEGKILNQDHLKVKYNLKGQSGKFYIYTFWQKNFTNNRVQVAQKAAIDNFQKAHSGNWKDKCFKVIGVGGKSSSPKLVFVLPYDMINRTHMKIDELNRYKKTDRYANFFYDVEKQTLK